MIPECDELEFQPSSILKTWDEEWLRYMFDFIPDSQVADETVFVRISFQIEGIEIGCIKLAIDIVPEREPVESENPLAVAGFQSQSSGLYQKIFISYSRQDTTIVRAYENAQLALGNEVFLDVDNLRAGENWKAGLARAIDAADIFQLFWSENSAKSEYCQYEWDYALKYKCPKTMCEGFIRPVFWIKPMPDPPELIKHLHFKFVPLGLDDTI